MPVEEKKASFWEPGEKGQEGNICCLVCLCEVPAVLLKVPREPREIIDVECNI